MTDLHTKPKRGRLLTSLLTQSMKTTKENPRTSQPQKWLYPTAAHIQHADSRCIAWRKNLWVKFGECSNGWIINVSDKAWRFIEIWIWCPVKLLWFVYIHSLRSHVNQNPKVNKFRVLTRQSAESPPPWRGIALAIPRSSKSLRREDLGRSESEEIWKIMSNL